MTADIANQLESIEPDGIDERRVDDEPPPGTCDICGDDVEPTYNPFREVWLLPTAICDGCHERQARKRRRREEFDRRLEHSEVPEYLAEDASRDDIELLDTLDELVSLHPREHDSDWWGAYIHGPVGTGKSVQCAKAVGRFLGHWILGQHRDVSAKYLNTTDFLGRLRESFGRDDMEVDVSSYKECGLLVLDDLGRERSTAWAAETLYKIVDYRYGENLLTLFTSNLSLGELQSGARLLKSREGEGGGDGLHADFDDRIFDRIWRMCGGTRDQDPHAVRAMTTHYRSPRRGT
jgi:DNA replication protein DnaC/primosomal protein DnaI